MWSPSASQERYLFLVAIAQPTLPWAINDSLPELYNADAEATLLTPAEKRVQAIDWSSAGKPAVVEHAGMTFAAQSTPVDAVVGGVVGGMVDRRQNLLALLELRLEAPGIPEIEEALRNQRPVGVSLMTRRYMGSTHKDVEHLGVTFTPAFGRDGSWTMEWATDAAAFRERLRVHYGQEPGLFIPEELRAHLRQFETQDSEYLKRIRAYRERVTGGNVDSWKSKLHPTIVVMASDAMDLDPPVPAGGSAPASPITASTPALVTPTASGRVYTPTSLEDHLKRIQSKPMVEEQITLASQILAEVEKEHSANPYRLGDPDGRKASQLVEDIEKLRQQKEGTSKKMLEAAIGAGFISDESRYVMDRLRDPKTAAEVRTQPYASQLATFVAASGQLYEKTLADLEKNKAELESERVKNQRTHEEAIAQKQLADQKTRELQAMERRLKDTETMMLDLAKKDKERDEKIEKLVAASSAAPPQASPAVAPQKLVGVTASDADSLRREKTGTPVRNEGSVMAPTLEIGLKRAREMTVQRGPTDVLSSISFGVSPQPSTTWKLGDVVQRVMDMSGNIRLNQ